MSLWEGCDGGSMTGVAFAGPVRRQAADQRGSTRIKARSPRDPLTFERVRRAPSRGTPLQTPHRDRFGKAKSIDGRAPSIHGRAPSIDGGAPLIDGRPKSIDGKAPSINGRAPSIDGEATGIDGNPVGINARTPGIDGKPPFHSYRHRREGA